LIFESLFETLPKHDRASLQDTSLPCNLSVHPLIGARQLYFEVERPLPVFLAVSSMKADAGSLDFST
jgi:hypothetical protein